MNKEKVLREAERYVLQGKFAAAVSEYQKILEADPKDLPILNTIGDLYVRFGKISEGLKYYHRLGTAFYDGGYKVKAIAIYRKITKLDPNSIPTRQRLAELYALQGLMTDARVQFLQLADACINTFHFDEAYEALQKLLSVDPENVEVMTRLVDVEIKRGNQQKAVEFLIANAERLRQRGDLKASMEVLQKAKTIDPEARPVRMLQAKILMSQGQPDEAVTVLEEMDPDRSSNEIQLALFQCLVGAKKLEDAMSVALRLFERDSSQFSVLLGLSDRFLAAGKADRALQVLDPLISKPQWDTYGPRLSAVLQKILAEAPDNLSVIEQALAASRKLDQPPFISQALEYLASYHIKRENFPAAMAIYEELLELDPHNSAIRQGMSRLQNQIGTAEPKVGGLGVEEEARTVPFEAQVPEIREGGRSREFGIYGRIQAPAPETELVEGPLIDDSMRSMVNTLMLEGEMLVGYGLQKRAAQTFEDLIRVSPNHTLAMQRLVDVYSSLDQKADAARWCANLSRLAYHAGKLDSAQEWTKKASELDSTIQSRPISPEVVPILVPKSIEAEAPETKKPEVQFDLSEELEKLKPLPTLVEEGEQKEAEEELEHVPAGEFQESLDEIDFYLSQGFWAEAKNIVEKVMKTHPGSPELQDRLQRCETIQASAPSSPEQEIIVEAVSSGLPGESESGVQGLGDVLTEFNGIETTSEAGGDFSTHYNLGIAFREMGLLEEAVVEVMRALSTIKAEEKRSDYLSGCSLLGLCLVESKRYPEAIDWLERSLQILGPDEKTQEALTLKYDLANACQLSGNTARAKEIFQVIHDEDPGFRDVKKRLEGLR